METVLHLVAGLDAWVILVLLGLLVFGESAALLAVVMPGELALLVAGSYVGLGRGDFEQVVIVAVAAAVAGQAFGYELGRRYGLRAFGWRLLRPYRGGLERAAALVTRHGGLAVLGGRWLNLTRVAVPLLVGAGRMPYRRFALYNVLGAVAWVLTFVTIGALAGASLEAVEQVVGRAGWVVLGVVAAVALVAGVLRRARLRSRAASLSGLRR